MPKVQPTLGSINDRSKRQRSNSGDDDGGEVKKKMAEAVCEAQARGAVHNAN